MILDANPFIVRKRKPETCLEHMIKEAKKKSAGRDRPPFGQRCGAEISWSPISICDDCP
jgi:hypothetical protein